MRSAPFLLVLSLVLLPPDVNAQEVHAGAHFHDFEEFRKVVDLRCTVCHTRERVEAAAREGQELAPIQQRMIERGAVLSDREKEVLGTFWGEPLKEKGGTGKPASPSQ